MTNINSSWSFSFSYSPNNQTSSDNSQCYENMGFGNNQMANMMQGMAMIFTGMDIIDNGQLDGSILRTLTGMKSPDQNNYDQQTLPALPSLDFGQPTSYQQPNNQIDQNQNPIMQMLMQMMAALFAMLDQMDDGAINGSLFKKMLGQNGNQSGNQSGNIANSSNGKRSVNQQYPGLFNKQGQIDGVNSGTAGVYGGVKLTQEQMNNARIIAEVGMEKGASKRDVQIAIATAMQESQLRNINYGDRDSIGLFQQRPSCGWGSHGQIMNPRYAAGKFFDALLKDNNRHSRSLTVAAQRVQRSAFPNAYAKWESMAARVTNQIVA